MQKVWLGILVLVFGILGNVVLEAQTDSRLNGTWVTTIMGSQVEVRMDNGKYEEFTNGSPSSRGTYTTNGNKIIQTVSQIRGEFIGLEAKWYSRNELPMQIITALGAMSSVEYSVSGNTLTETVQGMTFTYNRKNSSASSGENSRGGLVVWSFTDELGEIINKYYKQSRSGVTVGYSMIPTEQFPSKLDPVLWSGRGTPDVFTLESAFVRKYVESGLLLDLTDIYEANKSKLIAYPVEVGTYNGKVYALSWHAPAGAMFYRRSIAKKYLGTDDPKIVQTYFNNLPKFLETAKLLKDKSNGACVVVSSLDDLQIPVLGLRKNPWIVNGKLVIDPIMEQYLDICKTLHDNRYEGRVGQWSEGWFAGMNGTLKNENGVVEVFSYFFPTWGLHYVLKTNAPYTSGDWAMIPGPAPYRWGGTWIGAWKGTNNVAAVKEFIRYVTTDDNFLEQYARDTGDMVNNTISINRVKNRYSEPFLGGQNHYAEFSEYAKAVNGKLFQATDEAIERLWGEATTAFVNGKKTKAQALADFRSQVETTILNKR